MVQVERVIKVLLGHSGQVPLEKQESGMILVAHDLSPADAISSSNTSSRPSSPMWWATSHTAILARSLNILHRGATPCRDLIHDGELIIVDGNQAW